MPANPPSDLTFNEVGLILRLSEGRVNRYRPDEKPAHAYERHVGVTGVDLWARIRTDARNGQIALFTAFLTWKDQIEAAQETLNSAEGKWARDQMFQGAPSAKFPKGSHQGMEASILHTGRTRYVRYAGPGKTLPLCDYKMIVQRDDSCPSSLLIKTFYATALATPPLNKVRIVGRNDREFATGP